MQSPLISFTPVVAAFAIEMMFTGVANSSLVTMVRQFKTTYWADVTCFLAYGVGFFQVAVLIGSFGSSLVFLLATNAIWHDLIGAARLDTHNAVLNTGLYIVAVSFLSYWSHRAFHRDWLWHFHRFHHSATSMNPLVEHRNHPAQHAITGALFALPLAAINLRPDDMVAYGVLRQLHQLLVHSNIRSSWGWLGRWVFVSPLAHRVHHSIDPAHHDGNFADDLIVWDRLFGTYCSDFDGVGDVGVAGPEYNRRGPFYDVLADYGRAVRQAYALLKKRLIGSILTS